MANNYYDVGGIPNFKILKAKLTREQYEGFLLGNIIKYAIRANHKDNFSDDIRKASVYSKLLEEHNNESLPTDNQKSITEQTILGLQEERKRSSRISRENVITASIHREEELKTFSW